MKEWGGDVFCLINNSKYKKGKERKKVRKKKSETNHKVQKESVYRFYMYGLQSCNQTLPIRKWEQKCWEKDINYI